MISSWNIEWKAFKLQQTEMACLVVLKTLLIVNHLSIGI